MADIYLQLRVHDKNMRVYKRRKHGAPTKMLARTCIRKCAQSLSLSSCRTSSDRDVADEIWSSGVAYQRFVAEGESDAQYSRRQVGSPH